MTSAFSVGRQAGQARVVAGSKICMTRAEWEQTGHLIAHRMYQNAEARAEFMRGFMSAFTAR